MIALLTCYIPTCFEVRVSYVLLASYGLKFTPKTLCILGRRLLGFLFNYYSGHCMYSQATP